jgi:hypothetical protein
MSLGVEREEAATKGMHMSGRTNGRNVWVVGACALLVVGAMVVAGPINPPAGRWMRFTNR